MPEKTRLRREILARRDAENGRDVRSRAIVERALNLPEYAAADLISVFVGVGSEVETLPLIETALSAGKRVAVPWVDGRELRLFELARTAELAAAPFGLLEPPPDLRARSGLDARRDGVSSRHLRFFSQASWRCLRNRLYLL